MSLKITALLAFALIGTVAVVYHFSHNGIHHNKTTEIVSTNSTESDNAPNYAHMYSDYKLKNNLKFGSAEDSTRFQAFVKNAKIVEAHNKDETSSYKLGLTPLAHLTREEFAALKLGYKSEKIVTDLSTDDTAITTSADSDKSIDWTTKGAVTPVKNQGNCGSCWSFSATGALEGLSFIKNKEKLNLSEQELIDCSGSYGNQGCNGGLMTQAFQYVADHGISSEEAYPYTGTDGQCRKNKKIVFKSKGFEKVTANDPNALVKALDKQPVSVAIEADTSAFQLYKSGVLTGKACGTQLDHGVLAVGYGVLNNQAYYKVKNSWGPSWVTMGSFSLEEQLKVVVLVYVVLI